MSSSSIDPAQRTGVILVGGAPVTEEEQEQYERCRSIFFTSCGITFGGGALWIGCAALRATVFPQSNYVEYLRDISFVASILSMPPLGLSLSQLLAFEEAQRAKKPENS